MYWETKKKLWDVLFRFIVVVWNGTLTISEVCLEQGAYLKQSSNCFTKRAGKEKNLKLSFIMIHTNLKHWSLYSFLAQLYWWNPKVLMGNNKGLFLKLHVFHGLALRCHSRTQEKRAAPI